MTIPPSRHEHRALVDNEACDPDDVGVRVEVDARQVLIAQRHLGATGVSWQFGRQFAEDPVARPSGRIHGESVTPRISWHNDG